MSKGGKQTPLKNMFVFDLESCDDIRMVDSEIPDQRAWLSGFMNLETLDLQTFTDLESCLLTLFTLGGNQNIEIGVHNLSFDGSFIIPQIVKMGYLPVESKPKVKEFSVLIDERNSWYSIQIQVTQKRRVTFWDTLKLFPMPLKDLPNLYHTPTKKLSEDDDFYNLIRPLDHVVTPIESQYFYNDLKVLQEVLVKHIEYTGLTFKKTQASQSFYNFEQSFKAWKLRFPSLSVELDQFIRPAYLGGISYVNEQYSGLVIKNIMTADINSSYPFELSDKPLPYGEMIKETYNSHPEMNRFWVGECIAQFKLKPNKIPCIAKRQLSSEPLEHNQFKNLKWLSDSDGLVQMKMSSIDYVTYADSYDFKVVEWLTVYHWKQKRHKEIRQFILKNNDDKVNYKALAKKHEDDPKLYADYMSKSQRAKTNNNSFYGKFGEEIVKLGKGIEITEKGVEYVQSREETLTPYKRKFLPVAIATTAYGRRHLVTIANILGSDFIYCDTDSVYYKQKGHTKLLKAVRDQVIRLDSLELGAWEVDPHVYTRIKALRPKTYIVEDKEGNQYVTLAGLPADKGEPFGSKKRSCVNFENLKEGTIIKGGNGKLRPILTPTGKKLVSVDFEIGSNKLIGF